MIFKETSIQLYYNKIDEYMFLRNSGQYSWT